MNFYIVGLVKDEANSIIKSESLKPDIIILDLQLSNENELELIRIIRRRSPSSAIILLYNDDKDSVVNFANLAIITGVYGFLHKKSDMDKLVYAVNIICLGGYYINASIISKILNKITPVNQLNQFSNESNNVILSNVERQIIRLLAQGFSDKQIAKELNFSTGTIRNYITEIRHKTKMKSRIEIVIYSLVSGFIHIEHLLYKKLKL